MLIAALLWIVKVALPQIGEYANASIITIMVIVTILAGITMLFGAVGIPISTNLGSTIAGGILRAIGYLGRTLIQGIGWIFRNILGAIPRVYKVSRRVCEKMGFNPLISNLLATIVVCIFI